jgi:N-acetylglucosamine-6-phosphate deacetylase
MPFHHRDPGVLGAALGRPDVHVELILDQIHVSPTVARWTRELHPRLSYVSDCAPAAETPGGRTSSFGHLQVRCRQGACYVRGTGHLAGGGRLLSRQFGAWIARESRCTGRPWAELLREELPHVNRIPLQTLGLSSRGLPRIRWVMRAGRPTPVLLPS